MMTERRILFLDAQGLTAFRWHKNVVNQEATFNGDAGGIAAFTHYLTAHRGSLYYLLADVAEEGFQLEDIPYVRGYDRIAIVKRKLAQHHYGTRLAVAFSQGRRADGRRDETVLFAALTHPQHLEPWLQVLAQEEAALVGLFSVPQLVEKLPAIAEQATPGCLVITLTRGGLRQTYLEYGHLRFSRLTRLPDNTVEQAAAVCMTEAAKIHRYLAAQPAGAIGYQLPVLLLAHPDEISVFRSCCSDTESLCFRYLDLATEARRLGFRSNLADSRCETLLAHLLVRRTPLDQFAQSSDRRIHRLRKLRTALAVGAAGVFSGCLLFAAGQLFTAFGLDDRTEELHRQAEMDRRSYQAMLQSLPPVPLATDDLRRLVGRYDELEKIAVGPGPLFLHLGRALDSFPSIEVDRLNWTLVDATEDTATANQSAARERPPSHLPVAAVEVFAHLPAAMAGDHRGQLTAIDGLAERLRSVPGLRVVVLQRPFDTASDKPLRNSADTPAPGDPKFVLRIVQPL